MSEFGHHAASLGNGAFVDSWGDGPFVLERWTFEDSDRFGPYLLNKDGSIKNSYMGEKHPFWRPYLIWRAQGRRIAEDEMTCLWSEPKPTTVMKLKGRKFLVIEDGDEYGETIVIPFDPCHPMLAHRTERNSK